MTPGLARHTDEASELRRCLGDLAGILALSGTWRGAEAIEIGGRLLEALTSTLQVEFAFIRLNAAACQETLELFRARDGAESATPPTALGATLDAWLAGDSLQRAAALPMPETEIVLAPFALDARGAFGVLAVGSRQRDFPTQVDRLLLSVAANQAAISLRESALLAEQMRLARELDRRVAQRTAELEATNAELRNEVAERKRAEEALRRSEAFLAEAQRLSLTGSFAWRTASDEITWSAELYRLFALEPEAPVTLERIYARTHPDDYRVLTEVLSRARRDGADFDYEQRLLLPDGTLKHIRVVAVATRNPHGELEYIGAVQDVTEQRRSEAALDRARSELARVARATSLGALAASIAHEVNQPLSGIVLNASAGLRMLAADPPDFDGAREAARRTIRDGQRASEVVSRLRGLFVHKELAAEPLDLNEVVREVLALSAGETQRSRILVRPVLTEPLPLVLGDRVQLQQVILNLLLNARDAMDTVQDRPRQVVLRTGLEGGHQVLLAVEDSGVGLGGQDPDQLFEAFRTTKPGGMGIGLSVSRSIIERHRGQLWAEANPAAGAIFCFTIPAHAV